MITIVSKIKYTSYIIIVLFPFVVWGQCDLSTSVSFSSNAEIEAYIQSNPDCKAIFDIKCIGPDITDLALLSHFDTILSISIIDNIHVKNLSFLDGTIVETSITLYNLDSLSSLSKFASYQPSSIFLFECPLIESISLSRQEYQTVFLSSPKLDVYTDTFSADNIHLFNNVNIVNASWISSRHIDIESNPNYDSFAKIDNNFFLDSIEGGLSIRSFENFNSLGFPDSMVCRSLSFSGIENLNCDGFINKVGFFDRLSITTVKNIKNLIAFDHIQTKSSLILGGLDSLESLDGIPLVDSIPVLSIKSNPMLTNIQGISKTEALNSVWIENNQELEQCNISLICDLLKIDPTNPKIRINGNKNQCIDVDAVIESCETSSTSEPVALFELYPNPTHEYLTITSSKSFASSIKDINGRAVLEFEIQVGDNHVDVSHISRGIYFISDSEGVNYKFIVN